MVNISSTWKCVDDTMRLWFILLLIQSTTPHAQQVTTPHHKEQVSNLPLLYCTYASFWESRIKDEGIKTAVWRRLRWLGWHWWCKVVQYQTCNDPNWNGMVKISMVAINDYSTVSQPRFTFIWLCWTPVQNSCCHCWTTFQPNQSSQWAMKQCLLPWNFDLWPWKHIIPTRRR